jgi:outer membrane lipoprotein-sorting protein
MQTLATSCFLVVSVLASLSSAAEEMVSSEKARALIREMEALYRADSSYAQLTMRVETPHYERTMTMESTSLGPEKAFIRILSPKKDRGIATLKLDKEMWNYFPKINKVIKVPPSMMMGSWMGSDFTNDDLVKETTLADEYTLQLQETDDQYIIILLPQEQTVTVWGKIEYTIDKKTMVPVQQVFFEDDGTKVRVLTYRDPKQFSDSMLPSVLEMVPLNKEGHRTVVIYETLKLNVDEIGEDQFTLRNLKKRFR